jgi:hypothetical protein
MAGAGPDKASEGYVLVCDKMEGKAHELQIVCIMQYHQGVGKTLLVLLLACADLVYP